MTPDAKDQQMVDQVIAKVHWGAGRREVFTWLKEKHQRSDAECLQLWELAVRTRRRAVRLRAVIVLILSIIGMAVAGAFIALQVMGRVVIVGYSTVLVIGLACSSVFYFFRSIHRLATGNSTGAVD